MEVHGLWGGDHLMADQASILCCLVACQRLWAWA